MAHLYENPMRSLTPSLLSLAALALVACRPLPAPQQPPNAGYPLIVTGMVTYFTLDDVPRPLAGFVQGEIMGPVYFAVSNGLYCRVDVRTYTSVLVIGQPYPCRWRTPRGV